MVEGGLAVVEHTALVGGPVGGIDGDRDGSAGEVRGKGVAVGDVLEACDLEGALVDGAAALDSLVGVLIFVDNSVVLDVFEGVVHKTSVAGLVAIAA